ncbi:MAG: VanZ family protein [Acidimicrobiales bacterium]
MEPQADLVDGHELTTSRDGSPTPAAPAVGGVRAGVGLAVAVIAAVTLWPEYPESRRFTNLVPIVNLIDPDRLGFTVANAVGNVALFVPLGALAVLAASRRGRAGRGRRAAVWPGLRAGLVVSAVIELAQWVVPTGRVADVDDFVLNVLGAVAGALLMGHLVAPPAARPGLRLWRLRPGGPARSGEPGGPGRSGRGGWG